MKEGCGNDGGMTRESEIGYGGRNLLFLALCQKKGASSVIQGKIIAFSCSSRVGYREKRENRKGSYSTTKETDTETL